MIVLGCLVAVHDFTCNIFTPLFTYASLPHKVLVSGGDIDILLILVILLLVLFGLYGELLFGYYQSSRYLGSLRKKSHTPIELVGSTSFCL